MSRENVDLVRRLNECFARGEHEWPFSVYHPEIIWAPLQVPGIEPVYRGHDGVRQAWREWLVAFAEVEFQIDRYLDAGDNVVVILSIQTVGRGSGAATEFGPYAQVWTIRNGLAVAMRVYEDIDEGLSAAGVSEGSASE